MPTFQYNKLVRDNIAGWHEENGHIVTVRYLEGAELTKALCEKLHEEADEVHAAASQKELIEEIADVQQIIDNLCLHLGITSEEIYAIQKEKRDRKGGFDRGVYIEKVHMPNADDKWVQYCRKSPEKYPEI